VYSIAVAQVFGIGFRTFRMPFGSMLLQDAVEAVSKRGLHQQQV
jgi:hypothetical protein